MTSQQIPRSDQDAQVATPDAAVIALNGWAQDPRSNGHPRNPEPASGQPYDDQAPQALVESLRYLLNRFQLEGWANFPSRLAVVSALHGEGVTTISRTLASLISNDWDASVCWINLSWAAASGRRQQSRAAPTVGIADVLAGRVPLDLALHETANPRLSSLPAGDTSDQDSGAYAHGPMLPMVLDEVSRRFDHLVIDLPPILAGSAGLGLVRYAGAYLLVVRQGVTTMQQVQAASDELSSAPSIGVVLNGFRTRIPKRLSHFFIS